MKDKAPLLLIGALVAGLVGYAVLTAPPKPADDDGCKDGKCPPPKLPNVPPVPPVPPPVPKPKPKPKPWGGSSASVEAAVGGRSAPDGTEIDCDLPGEQHLKNVGGSDGAGLCVFTSIAHSARWQSVPVLEDFRDWMRKHPGGGYPAKVDQMIKACCKERNVPVPDYIQVEGKDLEILKLACKTGRMPGVTYSSSPTGRYGGGRIAHMVSLPHADDKWFAVLDNNYPGEEAYEWMTPAEFSKTYVGGSGGWAVILLAAPPPPVPKSSQ